MVTVLIAALFAPVAFTQQPSRADVERYVRASLAAWNTGEPERITRADSGGTGFGYRSREPRAERPQERRVSQVRAFLEALDYFRITIDQIQTSVDGDVGLAWGFFTEEFQRKGGTPQKVSVRFTETLRRDGQGWRRLLYHRDAQAFPPKAE